MSNATDRPTHPAAASTGGPVWPRLTGRWACLQVTTGKARVARVGRLETVTRLLSQLDIEQHHRQLIVRWKILGLTIDSGTRLTRPRVSRAVLAALGVLERPGHIEGDAQRGYRVVLPMASSTLGARLADPEEPLPQRADDPRVIDAESNGRRGATVNFSGLFSGSLDMVQRSRSELSGRLVEPGHVAGAVRWEVEQRVFRATNPVLRLAPKTTPIHEPDKSWFRMVVVPQDADANAVLAAAPRLERLGPPRVTGGPT